jgi:hypothetical protein
LDRPAAELRGVAQGGAGVRLCLSVYGESLVVGIGREGNPHCNICHTYQSHVCCLPLRASERAFGLA